MVGAHLRGCLNIYFNPLWSPTHGGNREVGVSPGFSFFPKIEYPPREEWGIKGGWKKNPSESSESRLGVPEQGQYDNMCLTRKRWGNPGVPGETGPHRIAASDTSAGANLKEDV